MTTSTWFIFHILVMVVFTSFFVHGQEDFFELEIFDNAPITNAPVTLDPTLKPTTAIVTTENPITSAPTTLAPVAAATSQPTLKPSNAPITTTPTNIPTKLPTNTPTKLPTNTPTNVPTISLTVTPSISKTPTYMPSPRPSISTSPSMQPSLPPSSTKLPSVMPSESSSPTTNTQYTDLKMTLVGISFINHVSDWEASIASFYESVYNNDDAAENDVVIDNAVVEIKLTNQNTKPRRKKQRQRNRLLGSRMLQDDTSVEVTYSQTTTYRSLDPNVGMNEVLQLPLSTEEYRNGYVEELKGLEGYEYLMSVSSISTGLDDGGVDKAIDGTNDAGGLSTTDIIGIACGSAAFLVLIGAVVFYKARKDKDDNDPANDGGSDDDDVVANAQGFIEVGSESNSLYGPPKRPTTLGGMSVASEALGDMSVVSGEYSYPEESSSGGAEELVTVYAPAGKLGMVIDSPDSGAPVIHSLKSTSPMVDKLQVGDRLVAIDDEDVRAMMAIKVSKLISRKSASSRKLTAIRYVPS